MNATQNMWNVWYSGYLGRWIASAMRPGGFCYFVRKKDAVAFALERND